MNYRREIEGLRALAVVPVILFHAGFQSFSGGFVGVDVFFVISGYLITTIILTELGQGRFSLVNFYERRVRRILPALFLVMFACLPFAWFWLLPNDMQSFSQSLIAAATFSSNLFFWRTSGYFDTAAELKPLLHTWSLSVEEQYYLLFPVFLMLVWRFGKRWLPGLLAVLLALSLAIADWASLARPAANFYLLPTRGWELLVGALVAFHHTKRDSEPPGHRIAEGGSLAGVLLILFALFQFDSQTPFPGLYALVPTLGTALIIVFANDKTAVGKLLGSKPLVLVGLISYSAYLWHQPLFAFARQRSLTEPGTITMSLLCVAILPLAFLSWRLVEQPFRDRNAFTRTQVFSFGLAASILAIGIGMLGHASAGSFFRSELKARADSLESRLRINYGLSSDCETRFTDSPRCRTSDTPELMLWGDSYAMHLLSGLLASRPELPVVQATVSVCGPFLDIAPISLPNNGKAWAKQCIETNDKVMDRLRSSDSIKYVVLSSSFGQYVGSDARIMKRDGTIVDGAKEAADYFERTLQAIRSLGKVPVIISPTPSSGYNTGHCLLKADFFGSPKSGCDFPAARALEKQRQVLDFLAGIGKNHKVVFLSEGICELGVCTAARDDTFIYRDGGHLSHEGSALIGKKMDFYRQIKEAR